jgi:hypothetical protein
MSGESWPAQEGQRGSAYGRVPIERRQAVLGKYNKFL